MDNQQGPSVYTGTSARCYVAAWIGGEFGGEWIHVHVMTESLCCAPETITTVITGYTPVQNKKFKKIKKCLKKREMMR